MLTNSAPVARSTSRAAASRGRIISSHASWRPQRSAYANPLPVLYGGSMVTRSTDSGCSLVSTSRLSPSTKTFHGCVTGAGYP